MPTFSAAPRFKRDFKALTPEQRERFLKIVTQQFVPDIGTGQFRPGLRVKGVQGTEKVYEMTWAPDGRATWEYGEEQRPGSPHVIWRRIGTHAIVNPGPP